MSGFWTCHECGAEMYGFENCQFCGAHKGGGEAMSILSAQCDELRKAARNIQGDLGRCLYRRKDVDKMLKFSDLLFEAANTIESLRQKIEDLEGMLGELPPEGKCAMLLVKQVDGEYIWGCELYDFASYCLVDSEADMYTGMTLNDPFGRADFADKLTMAKELRRMAASLDAQGDVLGIMPNDGTRYSELFGTPERAARTLASMCQFSHGELCERCLNDGCDKTLRLMCASTINDALLEWLRGDAE